MDDARTGTCASRTLSPRSPEGAKATEWRTMDCVDCHNRPTHIYRTPEDELDAALLDKRDRPRPAVRAPRGPEGAPGGVPQPGRGPRGDREGDRGVLPAELPECHRIAGGGAAGHELGNI